MKLKVLALLTIVMSFVLVVFVYIFGLPVAYVPENASKIEFITYHAVFITVEVVTGVFLLMHMLTKADIDIRDLLKFNKNKWI